MADRLADDLGAVASRDVLLVLATELAEAYEKWDEAASLPGWPESGCSQGCLKCFEKWLRQRADAIGRTTVAAP